MKKTYISTTGVKLTFPVKIAGRVKFISFDGTKGDLTTADVILQNAIESSRKFKAGDIALLNGTPNIKKVEEDDFENMADKTESNVQIEPETKEYSNEDMNRYPEVTDYQTAASILRKMGAAHQSVRTPENIKKKALEMNIDFPNLK